MSHAPRSLASPLSHDRISVRTASRGRDAMFVTSAVALKAPPAGNHPVAARPATERVKRPVAAELRASNPFQRERAAGSLSAADLSPDPQATPRTLDALHVTAPISLKAPRAGGDFVPDEAQAVAAPVGRPVAVAPVVKPPVRTPATETVAPARQRATPEAVSLVSIHEAVRRVPPRGSGNRKRHGSRLLPWMGVAALVLVAFALAGWMGG